MAWRGAPISNYDSIAALLSLGESRHGVPRYFALSGFTCDDWGVDRRFEKPVEWRRCFGLARDWGRAAGVLCPGWPRIGLAELQQKLASWGL